MSELDEIRRMPDMVDDVFVFPPTSYEQASIEEHLLEITNSKTKNSKRFKSALKLFMTEYYNYIRTHSIPFGILRERRELQWPIFEVMAHVVKEFKNE